MYKESGVPAVRRLVTYFGEVLGSTLFVMGPRRQFDRMKEGHRRSASLVYVSALFFTLVSVSWHWNGLLVLAMIIVQFCALCVYHHRMSTPIRKERFFPNVRGSWTSLFSVLRSHRQPHLFGSAHRFVLVCF